MLQEVQHGKAFDTPTALREALGRHAAHSGCRRGMHGASAPLSPGGHHPDRRRRTVGQCGEQHGACGVLGPGARTGTGGGNCYAQVAPFYAQQDINWINQETLCSDELEPSSYPCFSTPGDCARALYRAGIRVFSLSNNHTYDKGAAGLAATLRFWESMPEDVVTTGLWRGADDYSRIPLQTVNGITIAYLSYTEHTNGIPTSSSMPANVIYTSQTDVIEQQVRAAHQQADFVIVGVHWGVEDSHTIADGQRTLAQQLANIGSEFGRAAKRKDTGDREKEMKAFERGLELLDLSIQGAQFKRTEHRGIFKELLRLREVMCDYFVGENEYKTDRAFIEKYFYDFAYCARK